MKGGHPLNGWLADGSKLDVKRNVRVTYQTFDASDLVLVIIRTLNTNKQTYNK